MCVGQYAYLRVVCLCSNYILHYGSHIVLFYFGCCTSNCNLPSPLVRGGHGIALHILSNIYVGAAAVFLGKGQKSPGAGKPRAWDRYGGSFPIRQSRHTAARCGDTLDKNVRLLCFVVTGIGAATFLSEASICHGGGNIPVKIYLSMWMFRWG